MAKEIDHKDMSKKSNIKVPPGIEEIYPGITLSQYRLLCFIAFNGEYPSNSWTVTVYEGMFSLPSGRAEKDRLALREAGWIDSGNRIAPERYFATVIPMIKYYPDWTATFNGYRYFRSDENAYLWKVAQYIVGRDCESAAGLPYPPRGDVWKPFVPLLFDAQYGRFVSILPEKCRRKVLERSLEEALENDSLNEELLERAKELIDSQYTGDEKRSLDDEVATYRYFLNGGAPEPREEGFTMWSQALTAIDLLYRGKLTESYEHFYQALHLVEPFESINLFYNQLLTWFYGLCLALCRSRLKSERAKASLESLLEDSAMKFSARHDATRIFLEHIDDIGKDCAYKVQKEILAAASSHCNALDISLYHMVLKHYGVSDEEIKETLKAHAKEPDKDEVKIPAARILRNELTQSVRMSTAQRTDLQQAFGGSSIIGGLRRRESWELALSELTGQVLQDAPETEKRIIYFVNDRWLTAILEQSRPLGSQDESAWDRGKLLSRSVFTGTGYDSMDISDLKVARALSHKVIDKPDINILLPLLAHSGRLFTGQHYSVPFHPLKVESESPLVAFSGRDGRIAVSSNVTPTPDGDIPSFFYYPKGDGYVCINVNPMQKDILHNLLGIREFPANAAPRIRDMIESLKGIINVQSDLSGLTVIPTAQGGGRLALRIAPGKKENLYEMDVQAAPYEAGSLRCEPGQGEEDIYDDTGGEPRIIRRDLQLEYDNYMLLRDYAEEEIRLEFTTSVKAVISTSESLLKVLTWAFDNRDKCFVEWPEGYPLRFRGDVKASDIDITVKSGENWFEVEGEVKLKDGKYDLKDILKAMRESDIQGFIRLGEKDYIRMSDTIRRHLEALDEMMCGREGKERVVPVYRVGQLAEVLGPDNEMNATLDEAFTGLVDRMEQAYASTPELPEGLNATLRDYQKEGYRWLKRLDAWGAGACLADDMGLGKTLQSLTFLLSKASEGPSLVIAPKSVVPNWDIEAARFTPSLRVKVLNSESDRASCIASAGPGDLILATYGVLGTEAKTLASRSWNVVCLDEAHQIKNRNTRVSAAAMDLTAGSRLILTGTPIQNHLGELWNLFQFINPGLLGQWSDFKARYMQTGLDTAHKESLKDLVQPFILRRRKEDVLDELPEKIVYEQMVELSDEEMTLYEAMRKYVEENLKKPAGGKKHSKGTGIGSGIGTGIGSGSGPGTGSGTGSGGDDRKVKIQFFAELTNLRLAACSMSLVHDNWTKGSSKTEALKSILDGLSLDGSNRVLVFSQFTSYLAQIRAMLDKAGMRYLYLDGQTDLDERAELVTQFQNGDCPLFLSSLKAGGLGLNLTAANYVILLDPWWNPAIENQAMDRAHRLGQKRNVTVIRLIARHTIEEKILRMHETKQSLSDDMLDGTSESWALTMDDILDMVSPFKQ